VKLLKYNHFINELLDTSTIYPYDKEEVSDEYVKYYFDNDSGTSYVVYFAYKRVSLSISDSYWSRSFETKKGYNLTGEGDVYNVLSTISKITVDFLKEYDIDKLVIMHIPEDDENIGNRASENKRARVNKVFLKRYLPDNYDYKLEGFKSIITKKD
jgi:hypothetical protein